MPYRGFEKDRNTLKYSCPAEHYGVECRDKERCIIPKQVRIPLSEDRRIFSPVARSSYKWKTLYNDRSAVERVNSRIDKMFGFENHTIRGLEKMTFRVTFAFIMIHNEIECSGRGSHGQCRDEEWTPVGMLSFAVGKVEQKKESELRQFLSA